MTGFYGKLKKTAIIFTILALQILPVNLAYADESATPAATPKDREKVTLMTETERKNKLLLIQARKQLQNARTEYFQVTKNISEAKDRLLKVAEIINSLKGQLKNLDELISTTKAKISNVEKQIAQKGNELFLLQKEIKIKEIELENQKILLKDYLKLLYVQENNFYNRNDDQTAMISKLLLSDNSVGETFQEIQYFTILEQTGQNIFDKLDLIKLEKEGKQLEVAKNRQKLTKLEDQLAEEKKNLLIQRNAKSDLLKRTQGEEEIYRQLIEASKREQLAIIEEIHYLTNGLSIVEKEILEKGDEFNPDDYSKLLTPNIRAVYDFELSADFLEKGDFNWPINPTRGISAYFKDPSYESVFGIPHYAIDIPALQGTPIRAPQSGVVYKVHDKGDSSYSYIIIAHKGGIQTVFGHLSEVLVEERDIILPGEVFALSGGTPGSKGAGYLTTGAHLHFEVIKSGKHIDPLLVLPLEKLTTEYIPSYLKELAGITEEEKTGAEDETPTEITVTNTVEQN